MKTKEKKVGQPKLDLLEELLVLGGRYMFGFGKTWSGAPMLYISVPKKPGLVINVENLDVFRAALDRAAEEIDRRLEREDQRVAKAQEPCPGMMALDFEIPNQPLLDRFGDKKPGVHGYTETTSLPGECKYCGYQPARYDAHGLPKKARAS